MNFRLIFLPLSVVYALITEVRNFLYDKGILKSVTFDIPVISVGNLNLGGSGKTPQIEYLIRLLKPDYKIAVVSRGYKRLTKGYITADKHVTAASIGDEPFQIYRKFNDIIVAVSEDRALAIQNLINDFHPDIILLDDAFQHRRIKPGLQILLSPFDRPFYKDRLLPAGNLRELPKNARRADMVVITKMPDNTSIENLQKIQKNIKKYAGNKAVFFSKINYDLFITNEIQKINLQKLSAYNIILVTGIANPKPLYAFLSEKNINFESLKFGDHHHFSQTDINRIIMHFERINNPKKLILTTEKDYVKLKTLLKVPLYYIPIQTEITENKKFNNKITDYVKDYK